MTNLVLSLKAVVASRADVGDELTRPGDAVLIYRGQPRWLLLKCPCGCGEEIPVNLDARAGKAWRLYGDAASSLTLFPSVWRDTGCESHFIIWRDRILLFGRYDDDGAASPDHPQLEVLAEKVVESWPSEGWVSYVDVADLLREIPWDVLEACRLLAKRGRLVKGYGAERNNFRRVSDDPDRV
jgi:hypothetical protein